MFRDGVELRPRLIQIPVDLALKLDEMEREASGRGVGASEVVEQVIRYGIAVIEGDMCG